MKNKSHLQQETDCNRLVGKQTGMCMGGWYAGEEEVGSTYRNLSTHPLPFRACVRTFCNSTSSTCVGSKEEEERKETYIHVVTLNIMIFRSFHIKEEVPSVPHFYTEQHR